MQGEREKEDRLLMGLVGDGLVEPFGPEGLGISKGFLSVFDTAWMAERFKKGSENPWCSTTFEPTVEGGNQLPKLEGQSQ